MMMASKKQRANGPKKVKTAHKGKIKGNWKTIAIALYITFILLAMIPLTADRVLKTEMEDSYTYHLVYPRDGRQGHYYVERANTSLIGTIDLTYTTKTNTLVVNSKNIKVLYIYCRSMYEDECKKVYGIDPSDNSNYYKWYFIEKNHFHVVIDTDHEYTELRFIDTPTPYEIYVNSVKWTEGVEYNYTSDYSTALSHVPRNHTKVDLYFKPPPEADTPPVAILQASTLLAPINHTIMFDASESYDLDGKIITYILDFGDGNFRSGSKQSYYYITPGMYGVVLKVRDDDYLVDYAYVNITVVGSSEIPAIQGRVPNQLKLEDSAPWTLNLSAFEPLPSKPEEEFYWYLTGENSSLYTITGENSTNDQFVFTPVPNAFGSDKVKRHLYSTEDITVSQPLWINITPVNDPPTLLPPPDLIVHYEVPYTFDYNPYIDDIDTPAKELVLEVNDSFKETFITIKGLKATYNYPHRLLGQTLYATVSVWDGEEVVKDVISILVTSDYVPELIKELPDIWLYEGTTKYNAFDLDDYFIDPDNDAIYFTYGETNLKITIHDNHSVDISALSEWTGTELITFRATDPIGALAEDSLNITVIPVNDPPIFNDVPDFMIRHGRDYRFDLTPYISDRDNTLDELKISVNDTDNIRIDMQNHLVIIMNYPAQYLGQSRVVRLSVSDAVASTHQEVTITITDNFPPELLKPMPDILFHEDTQLLRTFNLNTYFLDVDGDVKFYTLGNKFVNITIHGDHTVDFRAPADWFGTESVQFRGTDPSGAFVEDSIFVTVLPVNDAPVLLPLPTQYGNESERWVLDLRPYIIDVDNNLSELEIHVDTEHVIVSGSTLIFYGWRELPNQVEVIVEDSEYRVSRTIEIELKLAKRGPTLTYWDLVMNILPILIIIILIIIAVASFIYRKKTRFTVEELFLIHSGGTLINHQTRKQQTNVDDIIFSGMFTAVQDFIKDSFATRTDGDGNYSKATDNTWALDEMKMGDNKILIERSEHTYLAVIFDGEGAWKLRKIVKQLMTTLEDKYALILPTWDGDMKKLKGAKEILSVLIKPEKSPKSFEKLSTIKEMEKVEKIPAVQPEVKPIKQKRITRSSTLTSKPTLKPKGRPQIQLSTYSKKGKSWISIPPWLVRVEASKLQNKIYLGTEIGLLRTSRASELVDLSRQPPSVNINKIIREHLNISLDSKNEDQRKAPSGLSGSKKPKTIKIDMGDGKSELELDPNKSIFMQMSKLMDKK